MDVARSVSRASSAALLAALVVATAGCPPRKTSPEACFAVANDGFADVLGAAQRSFEWCLRDDGRHGGSIARCLASDAYGLVAGAAARARARESRLCRADARPPFGFAGATAATEAAKRAVDELSRGLFGLDPDAARVARTEARWAAVCQERVLEAAGRCAATFVERYDACARARLAGGADDAFDLVACKGADTGGAIARSCDAAVASAVARSCAGSDVAPLFPGCEGDVAACARGHARRSASLALNEANLLCQDVLPGALAEADAVACFEPPPPEPVRWSDVPLPAGVFPLTVEFDDDGDALFLTYTAPGLPGTQIALVRPDGSGFRCLTCGTSLAGNLRPVQRFRDGRRVLVAGPNNANPSWRILECTPSLRDCQTSELLPIQLPANPDASAPILQYRVPWLSLDDAWLVWSEVRLRGPGGNVVATGRLARDPGRYVVTDARVIAPPPRSLAPGTDSDAWRALTQPVEAKFGALRGGRDQVIAGTPQAGQYDTSVLDLASGEMRRLTRHPDHDEGVRFSPDERWAVLQSGRTDDRVEFLGLLPRPPYIDWIAFSVHFVAIAGAPNDGLSPGGDPDERDCYVDPWLLDRWFERGDYLGQRLLRPSDGWVSIEGNAGGFGWAPDGTQLGLIERRWRHAPPEGRLRIASFPSRRPIAPAAVVPLVPAPEPTWATRYEDWIVPNTLGVSVVPGRVAGTATIRNAMPSPASGEVEVEYDGYSDDGREVLDGTERLRIPTLLLLGAEYSVDLTLSGARTGSMRGTVFYDFVADENRGTIVTELDGRRLEGPKSCYQAGLIPLP